MLTRISSATFHIKSGLRSYISRSLLTHHKRTLVMTPSEAGSFSNEQHTTNDEDQREVAQLKSRLKDTSTSSTNANKKLVELVTSVEIDEGAHKYVLIKAEIDGEEQYVVTSKRFAQYHRNAAEPMIAKLEQAGYSNIEVMGGGRISLNPVAKEISIYGFSYGFGLADHSVSQRIILEDPRYSDFNVTISDDGY